MSTQIFITSISATDPMGDRSERTFATATYPEPETVEEQFRKMMGSNRVDDVFAQSSCSEGFDIEFVMLNEKCYCFATTTAIDVVS